MISKHFLPLLLEQKKIVNRYCDLKTKIEKSKNLYAYKQLQDLLQLLTYAREISLLIR